MDVESAVAEHDECDEVVDVVEAVGHADGDLDPVVECLEPGVGVSEPDGSDDVGPASPDFSGEFDDFGDAAMGCPEHPAVQFGRGLFDRVLEQGTQEFLELPGAVELAFGIRVPDGFERRGLSVGQVAGVLQYDVLDAAHAFRYLFVSFASRLVPEAFADPVERVRHPGDDVEAVEHAFRVRAVLGDA